MRRRGGFAWSAIGVAWFVAANGCATSSPVDRGGGEGATAGATAAVVDDRDPVSLLPVTVDSILIVDLQRLRRASFAAPFLALDPAVAPSASAAANSAGGDLADARTRRGFDEVADVDTWVFARTGATGGERGMIELARGRFDPDRVRAAFLAAWPDARATQFGNSAGMTTVGVGVAFLSEAVLAFGPPWGLRAVAGVNEGRQPTVRGASWLAAARVALGQVGPGERPGMFSAIELYLNATGPVRAELAEALAIDMPIEHLSARIEVGDEARAYVNAAATSPDTAGQLAATLRSSLAGLQGRPSIEALGLGPVMKRAQVESRGARVAMGLAITRRERARVAQKLAAFAAVVARRRDEARAHAASDPAATTTMPAPPVNERAVAP